MAVRITREHLTVACGYDLKLTMHKRMQLLWSIKIAYFGSSEDKMQDIQDVAGETYR